MRTFFIVLFSGFLCSCNISAEKETAQSIIDKAIAISCMGNCEQANIAFTFRKNSYTSIRKGGDYILTSVKHDSTGIVRDELTNEGFSRTVNGALVTLTEEDALKYGNNVNSVHYFAQLPYGLNAPAVNKTLLGEIVIKGNNYYQIAVDFNEEGGGTDFEDKFVYWIHKEHYTLDYLAYSYAVNGGGIRFREAYNPRVVNNMRFVDYNNYKPATLQTKLEELPVLFENGSLKLLSKIETEEVEVTISQ